MIPTIWCSGKGKTMKTVKISEVGVGKRDKQAENFQSNKNTLYNTIMMDISLFICPNPENVQYQE